MYYPQITLAFHLRQSKKTLASIKPYDAHEAHNPGLFQSEYYQACGVKPCQSDSEDL
jgi:hypothetical protein